jgi:hypothetical protein
MQDFGKPLNLDRETTFVLAEIRAAKPVALYGSTTEAAEERLARVILPILETTGLPPVDALQYRWFMRELARIWRTRTGNDLAFFLELCLRKWAGNGLHLRSLETLVREVHRSLKIEAANKVGTGEGK